MTQTVTKDHPTHTCPACGHTNPPGAMTCAACSKRLAVRCEACGEVTPVSTSFCGICGAKLHTEAKPHATEAPGAAAPSAIRQPAPGKAVPANLAEKIGTIESEIIGERREVTALFVGIGCEAMDGQPLDSEDIYLITDEAVRILSGVIHSYEGLVEKLTADGLMALFGAPIAHENDSERAVRAALNMLVAIRPVQDRVSQKYGGRLQVRIGINTGLVIAGQVSSNMNVEYTVIGDTVSLADQLKAAADPSTILVSFATYQRTRPYFEYKSLTPVTIPGYTHPAAVFVPIRLLEKPGRVRGLPGMLVPMIGREDLLVRLKAILDDVRHKRHSHIVLITGEAGVGKSRLVSELHGSESDSAIRFFQGSCLSYARSKPLWLLASILRSIMDITDADSSEVQSAALHAYVEQRGLERHDVLPYLATILGLEERDRALETRLGRFDNAVLQKLIHAALRQVFRAEASLGPTVLIFDDLHWVDLASKSFLEHLIQTLDDVPLMIVLVSRDAERQTVIRPLISAAEKNLRHFTDIQIRPLSQSEGQLLVDQLLSQTTEEAGALKQRIVERAEGNPFFAEEIVRLLIDRGGLVNHEGVWNITPQAEPLLREMPATLNTLILARFDQFAAPLRRTLQKAAVLGITFPVNLLYNLNDESAETIEAHLDVLAAQQFLVRTSSGTDSSFTFRHALIQESIYGTLLKRDRKVIHERIAALIESSTLWTPDERIEALAYHYTQSPNPYRAIPYLIEAAESATRRCAHEIALQHYRQALSLMEGTKVPETDRQRVRALIGMGQALKFGGDYTQASQVLKMALQDLLPLSLAIESAALLPSFVYALRELADIRVREGNPNEAIPHLQEGLDSLGVEGAQEYPELWRLLMDRLAWVRFRQGKLEEAFALASSATMGLDTTSHDDPMTLASLYNTLGGVFWQWGNLSDAANYVQRSLDLYTKMGYAWGMAVAYTNLGVLHYVQGIWPKAAEYYEQAYTLRKENGYLPEQALNLSNLGMLHLAMGDHARAHQGLEAGLEIARRVGDPYGSVVTRIGLAQLAVIELRFEQAREHIQEAMSLADSVDEYQAIHARSLWALTQAETGNLEQGLETAGQALQMANTAGLTDMQAYSQRMLGILRTRAGDYLEAETLLRESVDLCIQLNSPYEEALALLELGRLYQHLALTSDTVRAEWHTKAFTALSDAVARFESLGAAHDLNIARSALGLLRANMAKEQPAPAQPAALVDEGAARPETPKGAWHRAAVVWIDLQAPPGADEETIFETMAYVRPALVAIAHEYQGQVIRRQGGLTVVFGAPVAYEDDAERAVLTAWQMALWLAESADHYTLPLSFSLSVAEGVVVAGQMGTGLLGEFVVKGEPVDTARQLAETASPGSVWVTEGVRAITERLFVYGPSAEDIRARLGGKPLWKVTGLQEKPRPARGLPHLRTRLIGRDRAFQTMLELGKRLDQGIGGLIWIEGEPGIGKSRLMAEFAASVDKYDTTIWMGKCAPQKAHQAFALFSDLFGHLLGLQPVDTPDQIRAKIAEMIQNWAADARAMQPYLEILQGIQPSGLAGERLANLEPEQLRQQTFVALRRLLKSLSTEKPLVVMLDDLHWIDPVSAELLLFLVPAVTSDRILFVCAQRRQGSDLPNDRLVRIQSLLSTQTVHLRLERLSVSESEQLLNELLLGAGLPDNIRNLIMERSEGNPYFIEEFVRMMIDRGYLQNRDGSWIITSAEDLASLAIPSSLETLIRSRIDALPVELKEVTESAAVIGPLFEMELLRSVCEAPDIEGSLRRLESRQLVMRTEKPDQWQFNHSLIETVVYGAMLKAKRKELHQKIAYALESRWAGAEAEHAGELAYRFLQAEEGAKALIYLLTAGEQAASKFANEEAISYFEQAAEQLSHQPDTDDSLRWRLAAGLGDTYRALGRYEDSKSALETGVILAEGAGLSTDLRAGLNRRLGETALKRGDLEDARQYFTIALNFLGEIKDNRGRAETARSLNGLAWTYFMQGQPDLAKRTVEEGMGHARKASALSELAAAENLLGGIFYRQNDWKSAAHHTTRAMVLREQMGYTWGVASTLNNLGILSVSAGEWSKAASFFERSLALRKELGDVEGVALAHNNVGTLARDQGKLDRAEAHFRSSLDIATMFKMGFHIANTKIGLAQVLLLKGELTSAQELLSATMDQAISVGAKDLLAEIHRVKAEILLEEAALDQAWAEAQQSIALAEEASDRSLQATAWRVMSVVHLARGEVTAAREAADGARELLGRVSDNLEIARIAAQAGLVYLAEGEPVLAQAELQVARETFMRLGASLCLEQVDQALKQASLAG